MYGFKSSLLCSTMLATLGLTAPTNEAPRYTIMDNDWGADSFAPFLVALAGDMKILGLASDTANTYQHQCAFHALGALELGNLTCLPVYAGATWPLINTPDRFNAWQQIHGKIPFQGAFRPYNKTAEAHGQDPTSGPDPERISKSALTLGYPKTQINKSTNAANFMVEMVHKYPGQVSIYSAGSLTNIALAVRMDHQFASLAKELIVMGGYVDVNLYEVTGDMGEADINSDINLLIDPEAAKIALTADFPHITIAGNVANQVRPDQKFMDDVYKVKNPYTEAFYKSYSPKLPMWDETAAALMVDPSLSTNSTNMYLDVDTAYGSPTYGNIHVYQKALAPKSAKLVEYVFEVDGSRVQQLIKKALQEPKSCADIQ